MAAISANGVSDPSCELATDLNEVLRQLESVCFPKDAWPLLDMLGVLTLPNVVRLKAVVGEQMVGFIAGDIRRVENVAWIATIGVLPEYRRRGIGTALLQACERAAGYDHRAVVCAAVEPGSH